MSTSPAPNAEQLLAQLQEAQAKIAAMQKESEAKAAEMAALQREAETKMAALQREAETKMADFETKVAALQRDLDTERDVKHKAIIQNWKESSAKMSLKELSNMQNGNPQCVMPQDRWTIVGKLPGIVDEVHTFVANVASSAARENARLAYIRNPPRHGKTLALELLCRKQDDNVVKVFVTYNNETVILQEEKDSLRSAIAGFWTRAAMSLCGQKYLISMLTSIAF